MKIRILYFALLRDALGRAQEELEVPEDVTTVAGLREGCVLRVENGRIELIGERPMRIFRKGQAPYEVRPGDDLNFLLD